MSFSPRYLPRASTSTSHPLKPLSRRLATPSAFSPHPPLRVSLLLSRPALLLRTPDALVSAYHAHSISLRHALSNPTPTDFYFRPDSLPLRRFLISQHSFDTSTYGPDLAGPLPDVGDLPAELGVDEVPRDKWEKEDGGRGEKGLERMAEEEVFCLVRRKDGRWEFPGVEVVAGEGLHEAVERGLVGVDGGLGGRGMDTWLVARKPMGMVRDGDARVSHFSVTWKEKLMGIVDILLAITCPRGRTGAGTGSPMERMGLVDSWGGRGALSRAGG
jgi:large subunit ribosomal protein L46